MYIKDADGNLQPRVVLFTNKGQVPLRLRTEMQQRGILVLRNTLKGEKEQSHAEPMASALRDDEEAQEEVLGGKISFVKNAYSTVRICSKFCVDKANNFLRRSDVQVTQGSNGLVADRDLSEDYLKELRADGSPGKAINVTIARVLPMINSEEEYEEGTD
jgi:hypothetical protein